MNTSDTPESSDPESGDELHPDKLAQLLASAGARKAPPARIEVEVRAAVHAEWQHLLKTRNARRQHRWLAAAAVLVCAMGAGWMMRYTNLNGVIADSTDHHSTVAVITQLQGSALVNELTATATTQIHAGDVLRTPGAGALRVELNNGVSLRVAAHSELHWLHADSLQLVQGAIYVDSHENRAPLSIHTSRGVITHLGTRYLVDVEQQSLHVAVREGQVAIHADHDQLMVDTLQQVHMGAAGDIVRSDLQLTDAMWQWADALALPFALENRSVAEFLQWVASETGCEVDYASPSVKAAASSTLLHGQTSTQAPLQAMQTVLGTTDFHAAVRGRQLVITQ